MAKRFDPNEVEEFLESWPTAEEAAKLWSPEFERRFGRPLTPGRVKKWISGEVYPKGHRHEGILRKAEKLIRGQDYILVNFGSGRKLALLNPEAIHNVWSQYGKQARARVMSPQQAAAVESVAEAHLNSVEGMAEQEQEAQEIDDLLARGYTPETIIPETNLAAPTTGEMRAEIRQMEKEAEQEAEADAVAAFTAVLGVRITEKRTQFFDPKTKKLVKRPANAAQLLAYSKAVLESTGNQYGEVLLDAAMLEEASQVVIAGEDKPKRKTKRASAAARKADALLDAAEGVLGGEANESAFMPTAPAASSPESSGEFVIHFDEDGNYIFFDAVTGDTIESPPNAAALVEYAEKKVAKTGEPGFIFTAKDVEKAMKPKGRKPRKSRAQVVEEVIDDDSWMDDVTVTPSPSVASGDVPFATEADAREFTENEYAISLLKVLVRNKLLSVAGDVEKGILAAHSYYQVTSRGHRMDAVAATGEVVWRPVNLADVPGLSVTAQAEIENLMAQAKAGVFSQEAEQAISKVGPWVASVEAYVARQLPSRIAHLSSESGARRKRDAEKAARITALGGL